MIDRSLRAPATALIRSVVVALVTATVLVSCTGPGRSVESFCEQLVVVTGPGGAEVNFAPGDPARLDALVDELELLNERAPADIDDVTTDLFTFFADYQRGTRDERRTLLVENEERLLDISTVLDAYALRECGVFLQRTVATVPPTASASGARTSG